MKNRTRRLAVAVALGAMTLSLSATLASPASAAPVKEPAASSTEDMPRRVASYNVPFKDAKGIPYPSGCHLAVVITRGGSRIMGDVSTVCLTPFQKVFTHGSIFRSRWWGWEPMLQGIEKTCGAGTFCQVPIPQLTYSCKGTGTHDFRVEGYGYLTINGKVYSAKAYDKIDAQYCP